MRQRCDGCTYRSRPTSSNGSTGSADNARRLHVIDVCQLLNKARAFKYSAASLETPAQALALCRAKGETRQRLYQWLVFNILVGNADNHLKNISFLVDSSGIRIAPAYDLLCTAVYDTRAMARERATWPDVPFTLSLRDGKTFANVTRAHVLDAGRALGMRQPRSATSTSSSRSFQPRQSD